MNRAFLTLPTVLRQLGRMASSLGKPFASNAETQGDEYLRVLSKAGLGDEDLVAAVDGWLETQTKWPVPAQLVAYAQVARRRRTGPSQRVFSRDACPDCGTKYRIRTAYTARHGPHITGRQFVQFERPGGLTVDLLVMTGRSWCDCVWEKRLQRADNDVLGYLAESDADPIAVEILRRRQDRSAHIPTQQELVPHGQA